MKSKMLQFFRNNRTFFGIIALMVIFRSSFADWNVVPTGSMKPTILEGDRIFVNKLAYDVRVPLIKTRLIHLSNPKRGDIVIFDSDKAGLRLVKRVIGLPGDVVSLINNQLWINGEQAVYKVVEQSEGAVILTESISGLTHKIKVSRRFPEMQKNLVSVVVPTNHYLVLGDNRDNSADSRVIGFVPRQEIVGRTSTVVLSLNYDNYYLPRSNRFFDTLN